MPVAAAAAQPAAAAPQPTASATAQPANPAAGAQLRLPGSGGCRRPLPLGHGGSEVFGRVGAVGGVDHYAVLTADGARADRQRRQWRAVVLEHVLELRLPGSWAVRPSAVYRRVRLDGRLGIRRAAAGHGAAGHVHAASLRAHGSGCRWQRRGACRQHRRDCAGLWLPGAISDRRRQRGMRRQVHCAVDGGRGAASDPAGGASCHVPLLGDAHQRRVLWH
mmetsp:Transcript_7213/g.21943  ORF Transcript_7213/g.21943 Transcript_7213/m.21943 type:complete len:220 (+) Transcript_7213:2129-2788(+)